MEKSLTGTAKIFAKNANSRRFFGIISGNIRCIIYSVHFAMILFQILKEKEQKNYSQSFI